MANDNVSVGKWSEKKMEGEEGLRTVECLRGRLLAERVASKVANEESDQLGNKLIELENQLRIETKSKNKAEKRLKFLMKKLESLNISYVSDESDKSEISSVSSSSTKNEQKPQITNPSKCEIKIKKTSPKEITETSIPSQTTTPSSSSETHNCSSHEQNLSSSDEAISGNSSQNVDDDFKRDEDDPGLQSSVEEKENSGENDRDWDDSADNSLALVLVDSPIKEQKIDPPISNGNVKDVLDALRYARESLQSSMERRHMIRVGSR